jgi:predicted GIY-YIG superfamily endonuclease
MYYTYQIKRRWPKAAEAATLHRIVYSNRSTIPKISTPVPINQEGTSLKFNVYLGKAQKTARDVDYKLEYIVSTLEAYSATTHHSQPGICEITVHFRAPTAIHTPHTSQQLIQQVQSQVPATSNQPQPLPLSAIASEFGSLQPENTTPNKQEPQRKKVSQGITFLYQLYDTDYGSGKPPAYIGITDNLRRRLKQHEEEWPTHEWRSIRSERTTSTKFLTRREAEREEQRLIRLHQPKYNVRGR